MRIVSAIAGQSIQKDRPASAWLPVIFWCLVGLVSGTLHSVPCDAAGKFKIIKKADLNTVRPDEFGLPGSGEVAISQGSLTGVADWEGTATGRPISLDTVYSTTEVTRRIENVWSYRIKTKEQPETPVIQADYQIRDGGGAVSLLSHKNSPLSKVLVQVVSLPSICNIKKKHWECEGGVDLILDYGTARISGDYTGTLRVTLSAL